MEQRLSCVVFFGFRCGVPPRQTQTDNDASGSPPRVAGRPTLLSVLITGPVPDGLERLWDGPLRNRSQAMGMNAVTGHKNTRPMALCVGAAWVRRPAAIFDHSPFGFDGMFFDYE